MKIIWLPGPRKVVFLFDPDEIEKVSDYKTRVTLYCFSVKIYHAAFFTSRIKQKLPLYLILQGV
jgi:hypothetical protein